VLNSSSSIITKKTSELDTKNIKYCDDIVAGDANKGVDDADVCT